MTMTMKTLASILLLATAAEAFSPSSTITTTSTNTALNHSVNTRHRIEDQELGIWPTSTSSDRSAYVPGHAVSGHEVRGAWTSYAPKHGSPDTVGTIGAVSRETSSLSRASNNNNNIIGAVSGEDIREGRSSYAPYNIHEGRVGSLGVIGSDGSSSGSGPVGPSRALPRFGGSSISAGAGATPKFGGMPRTATGGATKQYGLGSWKK